MKQFIFIASVFAMVLMTSCTDNQRARDWGGTATVELQSGQKLIEATWKGAELWYLTRDMRADESPETYKFQEKSSLGVMEGTVIFKESK
jgi:hypothetical protein